MSDVMIKELEMPGHTRIGDAVVLPPRRNLALAALSREHGDVDGRVFGAKAKKQRQVWKNHRLMAGSGDQDPREVWRELGERFGEWSRNAREHFRFPTAQGVAGLKERAWRGTSYVLQQMAVQLNLFQIAMMTNGAAWWRRLGVRRQRWTESAAEAWAEWWRDARLRWMVFRSVLLERSTALAEAVRTTDGFAPLVRFWFSLQSLVGSCRAFLAQRLTVVGNAVLLPGGGVSLMQILGPRLGSASGLFPTDRRLSEFGQWWWSFGLSRRNDLARFCREVCRDDKDYQGVFGDLEMLWTEPEGRGMVVVLLFTLFVLGEVLTASFLPAWCASATASCQARFNTILASATLSPSALASLRGAAGMA